VLLLSHINVLSIAEPMSQWRAVHCLCSRRNPLHCAIPRSRCDRLSKIANAATQTARQLSGCFGIFTQRNLQTLRNDGHVVVDPDLVEAYDVDTGEMSTGRTVPPPEMLIPRLLDIYRQPEFS
jgi:hypothetical protein